MRVSLIVTGGFLQHNDHKKALIESERLMALNACLMNLGTLDTSNGDEIILVEYGKHSRLKNLCNIHLSRIKHKYIFVQGEGFNQSRVKNAGAEASNNEIVCWINSDVIVQNNIFNVLRSRFEKNPKIFATAARHDVFGIEEKLKFIYNINNDQLYTQYKTLIDDAAWHYALKTPKTQILTNIKSFVCSEYKGRIVHDFTQGYINYGELIAITKEVWKKYPFDEEITSIVDSYIRDIIFGNENDFGLEFIHDETAIFHLSGSDYMQQEEHGSDKYKRLIEDMIKAAKKHQCMHHWLIFGYFREFDDTIKELNIPFKELFNTWKTPFMLKFFRDKEHIKELYGVLIDE
jgi:hypothetical protein